MNYQLVLQLPTDDKTDFDLLIDLEDKLIVGMGPDHDVDGHDFGSGEMNIFIYTRDPNAAFSEISQLIALYQFPKLRAAYRHVEKDEYTNLWPKGSNESFSVT